MRSCLLPMVIFQFALQEVGWGKIQKRQVTGEFFKILLGANVHPPKRKTTTPTSLVRSSCPVASRRMCKNGVICSTFGPFSQFVHFCPYQEVMRGKPKIGRWLGKMKTNGANSPLTLPPPKSPSPTSTLLPHLPYTFSLVPIGVVVRDDPNVPLF